eukprot:3009334-Amphidinium_carterae.1
MCAKLRSYVSSGATPETLAACESTFHVAVQHSVTIPADTFVPVLTREETDNAGSHISLAELLGKVAPVQVIDKGILFVHTMFARGSKRQ